MSNKKLSERLSPKKGGWLKLDGEPPTWRSFIEAVRGLEAQLEATRNECEMVRAENAELEAENARLANENKVISENLEAIASAVSGSTLDFARKKSKGLEKERDALRTERNEARADADCTAAGNRRLTSERDAALAKLADISQAYTQALNTKHMQEVALSAVREWVNRHQPTPFLSMAAVGYDGARADVLAILDTPAQEQTAHEGATTSPKGLGESQSDNDGECVCPHNPMATHHQRWRPQRTPQKDDASKEPVNVDTSAEHANYDIIEREVVLRPDNGMYAVDALIFGANGSDVARATVQFKVRRVPAKRGLAERLEGWLDGGIGQRDSVGLEALIDEVRELESKVSK